MSNDNDDKPDWREIDRRKDKSSHYGRHDKSPQKEQTENRWKAGRRKEAVDRIFMGEKGTIEHDKYFKKVHGSYGTERFMVNVKKYIDKYGMPDDIATLLLILDTKEESVIIDALDKIIEVYGKCSQRQKDDSRRKVSILKLTAKSDEVKIKSADILILIQDIK